MSICLKFIYYFIIALSITNIGCSTTRIYSQKDYIFNKTLSEAYDNIDKEMEQNRTPLTFESGDTVDNCGDYITMRQQDRIKEEEYNYTVAGEYMICETLALLQSSSTESKEKYTPVSYGEELLNRLDLRSFRSSLGPQIDENQYLLKDLENLLFEPDKYSIRHDVDDWFLMFDVVASADIDHDGYKDWIVWYTDEAKQGSYKSYGVLVIYSPSEDGLLEASEIP